MKTKNSELYLTILDEFLSGKGMDLKKHGLNKIDILNMLSFYQRILNPETLKIVSYEIVCITLEIDKEL
jgi:hypothetical protein